MSESTLESHSIQELCEMYAQAREQIARGKEDIALAPYAERMADVQSRQVSGERRRADGERAQKIALDEINRRAGAAQSNGSAA